MAPKPYNQHPERGVEKCGGVTKPLSRPSTSSFHMVHLANVQCCVHTAVDSLCNNEQTNTV